MSNSYFELIRSGINTTYQDKGRNNLYHIGIPYSGAMDNRNFLLANKLVNNNLNSPVIEFAYQGPHLKFTGDKISIAITGDVIFIGRAAAFSDANIPMWINVINNKLDLSWNYLIPGHGSIINNMLELNDT